MTTNQFNGDPLQCCPPLFQEDCTDGRILEFYDPTSDTDLLLRWLGGSQAARYARYTQKILPYAQAAAGTYAGNPTSAVPLNCCVYGEGVETPEACTIEQSCFGMLKRTDDPMCDGGNTLDWCETEPDWYVGGDRIMNNEDWMLKRLTGQIAHDKNTQMLLGQGPKPVSGMLDHYGLYSLLGFYNGNTVPPAPGVPGDYVYDCDYVKPDCIDWGGNPACGAAPMDGVLINGQPAMGKFATSLYWAVKRIYNEKLKTFRRIKGNTQTNIRPGDVALVLPMDIIECLLQCQACNLHCDAGVTRIDNEIAGNMLENSASWGIGYGAFRYGTLTIPFLPYDPINQVTGESHMMNADGTFNMFLIFRGSGSNRYLYPEYSDMSDSMSVRQGNADTYEGGRFLYKYVQKDDCFQPQITTQWRWINRAPYMQTIIKNVMCDDHIDLNASVIPAQPLIDDNCDPVDGGGK
ncbi:hypothetical protein N9137_01015 [Pseudomonadales bacterium]|nr:hypothetical protein [Pseudomonadales bacterium]